MNDWGDDIRGDPKAIAASNINPYLVDAEVVVVTKRIKPLCNAPEMDFGSKAADFGFLTLSVDERDELIQQYPLTTQRIHDFIGGDEFINSTRCFCLWLKDISANELRSYPPIMARIHSVRKVRLKSVDANTRRWANFPALFKVDRQPSTDYLLVPKVSSERRKYLPLGFLSPDIIVNPTVLVVPNATLYHFGILQTAMHNAWIRAVCGRMKSDYQYSNTIVYNNFPWPEASEKHYTAIETSAQAVLDNRTAHPEAKLADLYDPLSMPPNLNKAHAQLDKAVDAAYGYKPAISRAEGSGKDDAARVAFLFERYQALILPSLYR